ncbi:MAG: NTP transferase domain-containing protein [Alphaproteobacteria bacterium]
MKCAAIVLAGSRGAPDALCIANGVANKALIPVGGKPMLERVIEALLGCDRIGEILISMDRAELALALPQIAAWSAAGRVRLIPAAGTPGESVLAAIHAAGTAWPLLVTTADHPLLREEMISHLLDHAPEDGDATSAVVEESVIHAAYPETVRTYLRFRDVAFSGANLFLLQSPNAKGVVSFWRQMETNRKRPLRLIMTLGFGTLVRFVTGRLDLTHALDALGRRCGARLAVVRLPYAEAAIDVDKPADLALVSRILTRNCHPDGA